MLLESVILEPLTRWSEATCISRQPEKDWTAAPALLGARKVTIISHEIRPAGDSFLNKSILKIKHFTALEN